MCRLTVAVSVRMGLFVAVATLGTSAYAQFAPYGSYYSGWGAYPLPDGGVSYSRRVAQQNQASAQQRAFQAQASLERNINTTLGSQAQQRTSLATQQQASNEQFWVNQLQRQQAQFAARPQLPNTAIPTPPAQPQPIPETIPDESVEVQTPQGAVQWPTLLMDVRFSQYRAKVDQLVEKGVPQSAATKSRYFRQVYDAVQEMKETLKKMAPEVNAAEYMLVEKFLDDLTDKARLELDPTKDTPPKASSETAE